MNTQNTMTSPYHSKDRSTHYMGVPFSFWGVIELLVKAEFSLKTLNLSDLVYINVSRKTVNKLCVSDRVHT